MYALQDWITIHQAYTAILNTKQLCTFHAQGTLYTYSAPNMHQNIIQ